MGQGYSRQSEEATIPLLIEDGQSASPPEQSTLKKQLDNLTTSRDEVTFSVTFLGGTFFLALASAAIFFFSAQKASSTYVDLLAEKYKDASFIFEWVAPISVAATNAVFNHEVFLTLWGPIERLWPAVLRYFHYMLKHPIKEIIAWLVSAATILPFWYISMGDSIELFIPETISSLLCLFVFYNGAETCYQVAAYPNMQLLWLNVKISLLHFIGFFCKAKVILAIENCRYQIEMTKARALLVAALEDKYYTFYYTTPQNRIWFTQSLDDGDLDVLNTLLVDHKNMPQIPNLAYQSTILLLLKMFFAIFAIEQNFGHVIESYKAGAELHPGMGILLAVFNLVPSIGFTIKGVLGYGPAEMLLEMGGWRQSAMQQFSPGYYRWIWLMRFSDFFSGFSNNAVNTIGAKACGASDQVAFWVGLTSNVGTVFGFNGPQAELWFQTNIMESFVAKKYPKEILVQRKLREFLYTAKTYSFNKFEAFIRDPEYAVTLNAFFKSKDFTLPAPKLESLPTPV